MSGINSIVKHLNDNWKEKAFADARFSGVSLHGLATQILVNSNDSPMVYNVCEIAEDGTVNASGISYESINGSLRAYHRILGTSRKTDSGRDAESFGNEMQPMSQSFIMSMLVFVNRKMVRLSADQMDLLLMASMLSEIDPSDLPDGYGSVSFTQTGSEYNSQYLFEREFNLKNYNLEPDIVLFEFKYTIECSYLSNCIKVLCCPT